MSVSDEVQDLLGPIVATLGVELLETEYTGGLLRLTIDAEAGVTTAQLAEVNRTVSPLLDQHDPVPGRYTLEVSSPGLERALKKSGHFRRAVGETITIKLNPDREPRRIKGKLTVVDDDVVTVTANQVDGVDLAGPKEHQVSLFDIATARTVFEWGPSPKPGKGNGKGKGPKGAKQQTNKSKGTNKAKSSNRSTNSNRNTSGNGAGQTTKQTAKQEVTDEQ